MRMKLAAVPGVVLVAVAAAMWGTDPIIRKTMSGTTTATTIVFGEHVILVALIGHSDFLTPVVIQKVQPLVAVGGAALLLGERPRSRFLWFFLPALAGF